MRIETIHPKEIGSEETRKWRAHQHAPALASPYLTPAWAKFVGEARTDARVCVIEDGRGFLGVQRPSRFAAMGLGAPIADYQGLVGEQGLRVNNADLCTALKVGRIDLACVPQELNAFEGAAGGIEGSWIADLSKGADAYRAHQKKERGKVMRQTDNRQRKMAETHGVLEFTANGARAHFDTLIDWKLTQLRQSGQPAIWAAPWVRQVVEATYASNDPSCAGVFATLTAGGRLVAATYALRSETTLHVWLLGHDNAFNEFSPGMILARWLIDWAMEGGLQEVDFGVGDYQFKRHLSNTQRQLEWGVIGRPSLSASVRRAEIAVRTRMEAMPQKRLAALPGKAMRRLDLMRGLAGASPAR